MSRAVSLKRPRPEPSPPASPSSPSFIAGSGSKQAASKRLPASPPSSSSSSPAHVSGPLSPHTVTKDPEPDISKPGQNMSSTTSLEPPTTVHGPAPALVRSSSKHRLEDDESTSAPNKRRRTDHEREGGEHPEVVLKKDENTKSIGPLFRLSSKPIQRSALRMSDDLVDLVGGKELADSVRRKHPETGEKINKLRKSYENKVKDFKGKNKPVSNENQFFNTLRYPDEEWEIQRVQGNEMEKSLTAEGDALSQDMENRLEGALAGMVPGPLPAADREKWRVILDLELPPKAKLADTQALPNNANAGPYGSNHIAHEARRPKRQGTKRRYDDDAYEGYAEGFADDGYEDSDEDRRSSISGGGSRKRRRKETSSSQFSGSMPQWSTSPVSVGGNGR